MDDREQQRKIRHRLAVLRHAEEVSGNVAATCSELITLLAARALRGPENGYFAPKTAF